MTPGDENWQTMVELIPEKKAEMMEWLHRPYWHLKPLCKKEEFVLLHTCLLANMKIDTFESLFKLINLAEQEKCHLYLPELKDGLVMSLNKLLSHYNYELRIKTQLVDDKGLPLGVYM